MEEHQTFGVVGAGVMGSEVAQAAAQQGLPTVLVDVSAGALERARRTIAQNLRFQRVLGSSGRAADRDEVLGRITFTTSLEDLAKADFVVENVTEDWEIKRGVYSKIDRICRPEVIFAANTSVIPITKIGSTTLRPTQVIGTHFMNPVSQKPVVEVIRGHHTSEATVAATLAALRTLGKRGIVVRDSPGFVSNRVLMLTVNEAVFLVHETVASAEEIDDIFRSCFGHKMGPLETADLIGLDTVLRSIELLYEQFCDPKYRPCPLLRRMVEAGLHGRKSGEGFYHYDAMSA